MMLTRLLQPCTQCTFPYRYTNGEGHANPNITIQYIRTYVHIHIMINVLRIRCFKIKI